MTSQTRSITFMLCIDDLGVRYTNEEDKKHLTDLLKTFYTVTMDDEGKWYLGITLDSDYYHREFHLSMSCYVPNALKRFGHIPPKRQQIQPYMHVPLDYGTKVQYATPDDGSPHLTKKSKCL